jgi:hypothetical protein
MKIKFEENNSREISQTKKSTPEKINYNGIDYTYVGTSRENATGRTRVKALFECAIMTLVSCLVIPCFFEGFSKTFKNARKELLSGQEIVKHYVINPDIFTQKKSNRLALTDEESFQKGLNDSKNVRFD